MTDAIEQYESDHPWRYRMVVGTTPVMGFGKTPDEAKQDAQDKSDALTDYNPTPMGKAPISPRKNEPVQRESSGYK